MSYEQRSDFVWRTGVVSGALVAVAMTVFLFLAAFSPQISIDVPGVGRCAGPACAGGGD